MQRSPDSSRLLTMTEDERVVRVAIIGGGCAALTTAFELTRPEHEGRYDVTVYQMGWRLGGKGASGRGVDDRIEEHGLHLWMGFYENAFRLMRECYASVARIRRTAASRTGRTRSSRRRRRRGRPHARAAGSSGCAHFPARARLARRSARRAEPVRPCAATFASRRCWSASCCGPRHDALRRQPRRCPRHRRGRPRHRRR